MNVFEMVVLIVMITGVTGVFTEYFKTKAKQVAGMDRQALQSELSTLRREITELKTWANDLILGFDSTLHQQNARLQSLEQRALTPGSPTPAARLASEATRTDPEPLQAQTRA
jgi:hypothetical protein